MAIEGVMDTALLGFLAVVVINLVAVSVLMGRQMQMVRAHEQYHKEHFQTHKTVSRQIAEQSGQLKVHEHALKKAGHL